MVVYTCDGCGVELRKGALRYNVKIDVRAAYDEIQIGLMELVRDHRAEMLELIEQLQDRDPTELEESVYKCIELDLCPSCHKAYIRDPLRFQPGERAADSDLDFEAFLRSLRTPPEGAAGDRG